MGSYSRRERCERFIKEFNDDFIRTHAIKKLNAAVIAEGLMIHDVLEMVFYSVTIRTGDKEESELMFPEIVFDPEGDLQTYESCINWIAEVFGVSEHEIDARFHKANLL